MAGQFAQAYDAGVLESCVRQLLFIRPDKVVVVDRLRAVAGKELPEVQWLLQLPSPPTQDGKALRASNGKSWLRCRAVLPGGVDPVIAATPVKTHRASFSYPGKAEIALVHVLEVGDETDAGPPAQVTAVRAGREIRVTIAGRTYTFAADPQFTVSAGGAK